MEAKKDCTDDNTNQYVFALEYIMFRDVSAGSHPNFEGDRFYYRILSTLIFLFPDFTKFLKTLKAFSREKFHLRFARMYHGVSSHEVSSLILSKK